MWDGTTPAGSGSAASTASVLEHIACSKKGKEEAEEESGPPSLVSKASGGITENASFGIGKYLDFFPPLNKDAFF